MAITNRLCIVVFAFLPLFGCFLAIFFCIMHIQLPLFAIGLHFVYDYPFFSIYKTISPGVTKMSLVACTKAHYGAWRWPGGEWYPHISQLPPPTDREDVIAEQQPVPLPFEDHIQFLDHHPMGEGGTSLVYRVSVTLQNGRVHKQHIIKLPRALIENRSMLIRHKKIKYSLSVSRDENRNPNLHKARLNFLAEFDMFEKIFEPKLLRFHGMPAHDLTSTEIAALQAELRQLDHRGRHYIHEYYHFQMSIPAIFSAYCDGDLSSLRESRREMFFYEAGETSKLWQRCGF
jgi:hypothetical protein